MLFIGDNIMSAGIPKHLIAILRGISPDAVIGVGQILYDAGWRCIEVPLNSPDPFTSIEMLQEHFGTDCLIGAGTVLTPNQVESVYKTGAKLIVSPNTDADVIRQTKQAGMMSVAGCFTPTEAFDALKYGADALKIFPGESINPNHIKALRAVLPKQTPVYITGGIDAGNMQGFYNAGANGFGFGGALYKTDKSLADMKHDAIQILQNFQNIDV
jgi:2-dehydro-3-deoxyphosphogalactonate aldolase